MIALPSWCWQKYADFHQKQAYFSSFFLFLLILSLSPFLVFSTFILFAGQWQRSLLNRSFSGFRLAPQRNALYDRGSISCWFETSRFQWANIFRPKSGQGWAPRERERWAADLGKAMNNLHSHGFIILTTIFLCQILPESSQRERERKIACESAEQSALFRLALQFKNSNFFFFCREFCFEYSFAFDALLFLFSSLCNLHSDSSPPTRWLSIIDEHTDLFNKQAGLCTDREALYNLYWHQKEPAFPDNLSVLNGCALHNMQ